MTKHECAVVMAYTGTSMLVGKDFGIYHKYVEDIMGRPVWTHEMYGLAEEIKNRAREDFLRLCREAVNDELLPELRYGNGIGRAPTIDPDTDPITQKALEAGKRGEEVRFYIGGRKFAVRELAQ